MAPSCLQIRVAQGQPLLGVALVPVALRLPWFLLALPAGVVTDRVDRRRLIVAMDALRGLAFLAAAGAIGARVVSEAIRELGVDPEKIDAASA